LIHRYIAAARVVVAYTVATVKYVNSVDSAFPVAFVAEAINCFISAERCIAIIAGISHFNTDVICAVLGDIFMHDIIVASCCAIHSPAIFKT
jgi:hypothetical protein